MPDITDDLLIQQIYVSYFNRPADTFGLAYWKSILQSGGTIASIANLFSTSAEFNSIYSGPSIEKIGLLYKNMFNRTADLDGLLYWTNLLDSGSYHFSKLLTLFQMPRGVIGKLFKQELVRLRDLLLPSIPKKKLRHSKERRRLRLLKIGSLV